MQYVTMAKIVVELPKNYKKGAKKLAGRPYAHSTGRLRSRIVAAEPPAMVACDANGNLITTTAPLSRSLAVICLLV